MIGMYENESIVRDEATRFTSRAGSTLIQRIIGTGRPL